MMDCNTCDRKNVFTTTVPLAVLENTRASKDMTIKRLVHVIVLLIVLLVASNVFWVWRETRFETVRIQQENEDGINNYIGNDGDIYNGNPDNNLP